MDDSVSMADDVQTILEECRLHRNQILKFLQRDRSLQKLPDRHQWKMREDELTRFGHEVVIIQFISHVVTGNLQHKNHEINHQQMALQEMFMSQNLRYKVYFHLYEGMNEDYSSVERKLTLHWPISDHWMKGYTVLIYIWPFNNRLVLTYIWPLNEWLHRFDLYMTIEWKGIPYWPRYLTIEQKVTPCWPISDTNDRSRFCKAHSRGQPLIIIHHRVAVSHPGHERQVLCSKEYNASISLSILDCAWCVFSHM